MSKRNRENRARKQRAGQKRKPSSRVPPMFKELAENPEARRRLAIMIPFLYLAKDNPYKPGMVLPAGSIIIGLKDGKQGYIPRSQVPQLIAETERELDVTLDEIVTMLADSEAHGLLEMVEAEPDDLQRQTLDALIQRAT